MIELTVNMRDYPKDWNLTPPMVECWLLGKLQAAGIPARGKLVFRGVKRGTLTRLNDPEIPGALHYIWKE